MRCALEIGLLCALGCSHGSPRADAGTQADAAPPVCRADGWCKVPLNGIPPDAVDTSLSAISGSGPTDVRTGGWTGSDPVLLSFDGASWNVWVGNGDGSLAGVWESGAGAGWAVGYGGAAYHWTTGSRGQVTIASANLDAIWGASPTDVWVAGDAGTLLHGDGAAWTATPSGTAEDLLCVWGSGANDVWVGGSNGTLLHWTGSSWGKVDAGVSAAVTAIWIQSAGDGWFGTSDGQLARWNGATWSLDAFAPGFPVTGVWGSGANDVWAVGASVLGSDSPTLAHWDGAEWSRAADDPIPFGNLRAVWGASANDVWVVGDGPVGLSQFTIWRRHAP